MAIWQFRFAVIPISGLLRVHGEVPRVLPQYAMKPPEDLPNMKDPPEYPNYWDALPIPESLIKKLQGLLPQGKHWSADAIMFGEDGGNEVVIWRDDLNCRISAREPDARLLHLMVEFATELDCVFAIGEGGEVIPGNLDSLADAFSKSRAVQDCQITDGFVKGGEHVWDSKPE